MTRAAAERAAASVGGLDDQLRLLDTAAETLALVITSFLFFLTAVAEIVGCYLPYLWLRKGASVWLCLPAGVSLAVFAWLLTLHPTGAGRTYAAYGGAYVAVAVLWLWIVEGQQPDRWDPLGPLLAEQYA